jgi:hypothetical protein
MIEMEISEVFGKAVNTSFVSITDSLRFLGLSEKQIEEAVKKRKFLISQKSFDIAIDYKPKINQLYLYLVSKKSSKKLVKSFKPNKLDFKSMVIFLGNIILFGKKTEVRFGAFGISSSELVKSLIKFKKK